LCAQFQRDHYIILPALIEPDLLATILKRIESAPSVQKEDDGVISESIIDDPHTYNLFFSTHRNFNASSNTSQVP
jgi:hypothetical protein